MNLPEPPNPDRGNYSFLLIHTREELIAYGEACYRKAIEDAEKKCASLQSQYRKAYKESYNHHTDGMSDGAAICAAAMLELLK